MCKVRQRERGVSFPSNSEICGRPPPATSSPKNGATPPLAGGELELAILTVVDWVDDKEKCGAVVI